MSTQHTPGPWHVGEGIFRPAIVYDAAGWAVATCPTYPGQDDIERMAANARLISAAPDLLAALVELVETLGNPDSLSKAKDAITKARGACHDNQ